MANNKTSTTEANTKQVSTRRNKKLEGLEDKFLIVGMGASAGGLESFKEFFKGMPKSPNMAFVLVQHLDPTHESLMVHLLKKHTDMEVSEVKDNLTIEANHIYVIPPNKNMAVFNGVLHLMDPTSARGFRKPIDFFFRSLAQDQNERAVGIILSGTGTEGTLSLKDIKGHGGLSIVQNPKTAKYDGMPRSAIAAGAEDFVLNIKEMPKALLDYAKKRKFRLEGKEARLDTAKELLEKVFILIRNETGCNFGDYKSTTVIRRINKRMALNQIEKLEAYVRYLQKNKEEVIKLFKELLIGVTSFFRDKEAFETFQNTVIPEILNKKRDGDTIRMWVPGCSTGEEAYSLAILFDEVISKQSKSFKVQIFASDLDGTAINYARQGVYPETIIADVSKERLSQYFLGEKTSYRIKKKIRDQIVFAEHNLIKDAPFSKQDLISCRNLLIYLNLTAQKKVFALFHYALEDSGILFLGSSESLGEFASMFEPVDRKHKIFRKKNVKLAKIPEIDEFFYESNEIKFDNHTDMKIQTKQNFEGKIEQLLLANYAPACAIINNEGDAVYFFGNTGKYLQPSPGEAKLNIVEMARNGLKTDLRALIVKVRKSKKAEVRSGVVVKTNDNSQTIDLKISPLDLNLGTNGFFMITFEDRPSEKDGTTTVVSSAADEVTELRALEQELVATKEYLRSTIEELEISNEELKSSNEELQSSNEELQSTNEEMETSKEELQSVNEEIVTVNTELQSKIDELAQAYDDMSNLLASTEIGTIFLDSELNIKRFTPRMGNIINLIETDVGRPIGDLASSLIDDNFETNVKQVLETLVTYSQSVKDKDGTWYKMKIMPYRTGENMIEGVVITFVDVTEEKLLALELEKTKKNYEHLLEMTKTVVYTQDKNLKYTSIASIHPDFQFKNMIGKSDADFFTKEDVEVLENIKKKVIKTKKASRQTISLSISGSKYFFDLLVRPVIHKEKITGIACSSIDVTEIAIIEKELLALKKEGNGK